ncbi:hypothetical protein Tco_0916160 [Tanacetum coccineum]
MEEVMVKVASKRDVWKLEGEGEWSSIYRQENLTVTRGGPGVDCMMVVKEIENELLEEVEKLEWWFEQDIDDEGEEDEEDGGGDEV